MQSLNDLPLPPGYNPTKLEKDAQALQQRMEPAPVIQQQIPVQEPEVEQPEVLAQAEEPVAPIEEVQAPVEPETKQAKSFREMKHQMQRLQQERDAFARQLQQSQSKTQESQVQTQTDNSVQDSDLTFRDDEYIEAKHVNLLAQELKAVKNQMKQYQTQSVSQLAETRLRAEFPDFDKVFTQENCQSLAMLDPDLALSIDADKDVYRKAKLAYKSIKNMGLDTQEEVIQDKAQIQRNAIKPKPAASIAPNQSSSPLARVGSFESGLTKDLQSQLYKEMMESRRGY